MDEIRQVEIELKRLREDAEHQRMAARHARKENDILKSRNEYLVNKLKEASYVYGEAGKRLLYFINNQVNPILERLNSLEKGARKLGAEDRNLGATRESVRKLAREDVARMDGRLEAFAKELEAEEMKIGDAVKRTVRKSERGDAAMAEKLDGLSVDFDKRLASMKSSLVKSTSATMASLEKELDRKISMLRERSLLLGKDIEALRKFGQDINGLDGRLQNTISNLSQTRLDMDKLKQSVKGTMSAAKGTLSKDMKALSDDVDKRLLETASGLRQADEKNLGEIRMQLEKNREELDGRLEAFGREMQSSRRKMELEHRKSGSALKSGLNASLEKFDEKLQMMEKDIEENSRSHKSLEDAALSKLSALDSREAALSGEVANLKKAGSGLSKAAAAMEQRMDRTEAAMNDSVQSMRENFEKEKIVMRNALEKNDKKIDDRMRAVASELGQAQSAALGRMKEETTARLNSLGGRADIQAKEISRMKPMAADIKSLADALTRCEQADSDLRAGMENMSREIRDKSEREDMKLRKELDTMKSQISGGMEAAESRLTKENVRAFSAARQNLRKDLASLREDSAALKAEMKGLQTLARTVETMQHRLEGLGAKADALGHSMDKVAEATGAKVENEALRLSKEMAGLAAQVKADIKDMMASEKERFARQSAALDAKQASLKRSVDGAAKRMAGIEAALGRGTDFSQANRKLLKRLEAEVRKAGDEIVGWKKEYKVELEKILKEIEG